MNDSIRQSPVRFETRILRQSTWQDWPVALEYAGEGEGPWLIDLSHLPRWDYQHIALDAQSPAGLTVPASPGQVNLQDGTLINRMNRTQVAIWHLDRRQQKTLPAEPGFTDMTEAHCMLAVVGRQAPEVMEQVCQLDLFPPGRGTPFLTQGPILHIPCQIVTLNPGCVLFTFSRGYGQTFADSLLHSTSSCGLRPAGEEAFTSHLA